MPEAEVGIAKVTGVSLNCRWPGFGSTAREARPWSVRAPAIAMSLRATRADWFGLQEAAEKSLGKGWSGDVFGRVESDDYQIGFQAHGLNSVGWNNSRFLYVSTLEITLPAFKQWPGRTGLAVKVRERTTGYRLRIACSHIAASSKSPPVSNAQARKFRGIQFRELVSTLNDDEDDWPTFLAMDGNSTVLDRTADSPRVIGKKYGWRWPVELKGIDIVMSNYGARIDSSKHIEMGTLSDHDGRLVTGHTTKR